MNEKSETLSPLETQATSQKKPDSNKSRLKRTIANLGLAAGTTLASLFASPPHLTLAQSEPQIISDEQSPEYFTKKISALLDRGKTVTVAEGVFRISSDTEKLDRFSKAVLSEDLRETPFIEPKSPMKIAQSEEVHNPVIVEHGGSKYFVYRTTLENGERKVVAVALRPSNWNHITRIDKDTSTIFDKNNQQFYRAAKMQIEGAAETNFNRDLSPELFATKGGQEKHIPIMRTVVKKASQP